MKIICPPCNRPHNLNAGEMRNALLAVINGDAQIMTPTGVETMCLSDAVDMIAREGRYVDES